MKKSELLKAAKEVKTELGFEEIDLKGDIKAQLIEVASLIGADGEDAIEEDELNDLTKETKEILLQLKDSGVDETPEEEEKPTKKKATKKAKAKKEVEPEPEEETETEDEDELVTKIKTLDLADLKALIKSEGKEVFPIASRGLPLQKNADKLRVKALKDLGEEVEESETAPVKEEKPAKEKKAPKAKTSTKSKENGTYLTRLWTVKNPKLTPDEIFDKLQEKGVTMSLVSVKLRQNEVLAVLKIQAELKK